MKRKIIHIDQEVCTGCGICAAACHEGAIELVDGKAKLVQENYCDGLGDCLPACPVNAISFEEREAPAYDEAAVLAAKQKKMREKGQILPASGCPGGRAYTLDRAALSQPMQAAATESELRQWPCQLKLVPASAPFFNGAKLLIAADCTAYAYAAFHREFMRGKVTVIGCPKLDGVDYSEKLTAVLRDNDIRSVTILRMEVPCCGGLENAAKKALQDSGKFLPWQVVTIGTDGTIRE
jgi:NAD-dependent dihydropyrimidine dehydrogenase PreA subunit